MRRSDRKPLGCGICPYKTNSACHLERHLRIHTGQKPYACNMCSYKATDGGLLKRHMRIHSGEKPFTCQICGHKTAQSCSLKDHMAVHTGKKRYACDICPFQCSRIGRLRDHQLQHKVVSIKKEEAQQEDDTTTAVAQTTSKCPHCGLEFPGMPNLNRHIATAHSKTFEPNEDLQALQPHVSANALRCNLCSAPAETLETLNTHYSRHILFRCLDCTSTFETPSGLTAHMPQHSEEFIFHCDKCDFKSKTRNELRGHERIHNNSQSMACTECDFVSKSSSEFTQHLQTHTSIEMVQCNICSTKFSKTTELREHMVVHYSRSRSRPTRRITSIPESDVMNGVGSFHCYYCSYKCSEEDQMAKHIQGVHVASSVSSQQLKEDANPEVNQTEITEGTQIEPEEEPDVNRIVPLKIDPNDCAPFSHSWQGPNCNHCHCNSYGLHWLRNLECHYRPLTHFMNDTDLPALQFKCRSCSKRKQAKAPNDSQQSDKCLLVSVTQSMNQAQETHGFDVQNAPNSTQTQADDGLVSNATEIHQPQSSDVDQVATTEPSCKKTKTEIEPITTENVIRTLNLESNGEKSKSAEILLSKLRHFFNESFPKMSCNSEGESDQSTLTANTQEILTIELSSDSNASDNSY